MSNSQHIEVVKALLVKLESREDAIQKKLDSAETGFRGWWNGSGMSPQQIEVLTREQMFLLQKIEESSVRLELLCAPTTWQKMDAYGERLTKYSGQITAASCGLWAWLRYWSIKRMKYASYTKEQWHWRKEWLAVESPFPPALKKIIQELRDCYYFTKVARGKQRMSVFKQRFSDLISLPLLLTTHSQICFFPPLSVVYLVWYYSTHPAEHEFLLTGGKAAVSQLRKKFPDDVIVG